MQVPEKANEKLPERLTERHCVPCEGGVPALDDATSKMLLAEVPGWALRAEAGQPAQITKRFEFADFLGAMAFVDKMAALAERRGTTPTSASTTVAST